MKFLSLGIATSLLTELIAMILFSNKVNNIVVMNFHTFPFYIFIGLAYYQKVKNESILLGRLFLFLSFMAFVLTLYFLSVNGIFTLRYHTFVTYCILIIFFSLLYFYYTIIITDEIDLLQDAFFIVTSGFFIFYMVSLVALFTDEFESVQPMNYSLYILKDITYSLFLILVSIGFLLYRKKIQQGPEII